AGRRYEGTRRSKCCNFCRPERVFRMKFASTGRIFAATAAFVALIVVASASRAAPPAPAAADSNIQTVEGITQPEEQRKLVFPAQGNVREVMVKEGEEIKRGQVLARL